MMEKFKDIYKGQTLWIVGKGPSLQYLTKEHIGSGPVITINAAIVKIEELDLPNPIFAMIKDGGNRRHHWSSPIILKPDCDYTPKCGDKCGNLHRPKQGATLLVHKHESLYCFPDYSPRYVFEWEEFGLRHNNISLVIAIEVGILMGCKKFCFVSLDGHVNGSIERYIPGVGVIGEDGAYLSHRRRIKPYLAKLDHSWITPKK